MRMVTLGQMPASVKMCAYIHTHIHGLVPPAI